MEPLKLSMVSMVKLDMEIGILDFLLVMISLDFINYGNGSYNYYLQAGSVGLNTGNFYWHHKSTERLMTLTYGGRLGIGITQPDHTLHVIGDSRVTGIATFEVVSLLMDHYQLIH